MVDVSFRTDASQINSTSSDVTYYNVTNPDPPPQASVDDHDYDEPVDVVADYSVPVSKTSDYKNVASRLHIAAEWEFAISDNDIYK